MTPVCEEVTPDPASARASAVLSVAEAGAASAAATITTAQTAGIRFRAVGLSAREDGPPGP
jgi:hypothetical protein